MPESVAPLGSRRHPIRSLHGALATTKTGLSDCGTKYLMPKRINSVRKRSGSNPTIAHQVFPTMAVRDRRFP
jgi:hypothetical protein